jgi:mono/diheme cytochrome c family protein
LGPCIWQKSGLAKIWIAQEADMRFVSGFITAVVIAVLLGLAITYSGAYNVSADVPDPGIMQWLLSTNMQRSVVRHAQSVSAPAQLGEAQVQKGIAIYKETCIYCHGAPGQDPGDIGKGLNPEPPYLPDTVARWSSTQLFWIIKNGIKMTGMASYGAVHKDDEIWSLVAFVQRLPNMTPEQYKQLEAAGPAG